MTIDSTSGNILRADTEAVVNTVNTVGVMGKGIALQFKRAYPELFAAYRDACRRGEVQLGRMWVWSNSSFEGPRYVINFPTKGHWRSRSRLTDIETGLDDLATTISRLGVTSIALPPLGCGNGGLDWAMVRPLIVARLGELADVDVHIFEPVGAPPASDMLDRRDRPSMSVGKAALVLTIARYAAVAWEASIVEVQKLMYFLQESGEPLNLSYVKGIYGPYAENLSKVLVRVEGHFLTGYGDGSRRVVDTEPIAVLPEAVAEAEAVVAKSPDTRQRIDGLLDLVNGFESAYFLELMATVHWVVTRIDQEAADAADVVMRIREWSPRKAGLFTESHVSSVLSRLRSHGLIAAT